MSVRFPYTSRRATAEIQVKMNRMRKSTTEPRALTSVLSSGLCLLLLAGQAAVHAQQNTVPPQQKQPSGASTATATSPPPHPHPTLSTPSAHNGPPSTQPPY